MNIFKSLKQKLSNVPQDIVKSFQALRSPSKDTATLPEEFGDGINVDCGAELLDRYQSVWSDIHGSILGSAKAAEDIDKFISEVHIVYERQNEAYEDFNKHLAFLDSMITDMHQTKLSMDSIEALLKDVETSLCDLQLLKDREEFEKRKKERLHQHELSKQRKQMELEKFKVQRALQHSERVKMHEAKIQESLQLRQEAFEETYQDGIQQYKQSGHIPAEMEHNSIKTTEAQLAEVTIEDDKEALEEFLGTQEDVHDQIDGSTTTEQTEPPDTLESPDTPEDDVVQETLDSTRDSAAFQKYLTLTTPELESSGDTPKES